MTRDGYIDPRRLYTTDGINAAVGLSDKEIGDGRRAGKLTPVFKANRYWYLGEQLIDWIQSTGKKVPGGVRINKGFRTAVGQGSQLEGTR